MENAANRLVVFRELASVWHLLWGHCMNDEEPGWSEPLLISAVGVVAQWSPWLVRHLEEAVLGHYLARSRWFGGKRRRISSLTLVHEVPGAWPEGVRVQLLEVGYAEGGSEQYFLPLGFWRPTGEERTWEGPPGAALGRFATGEWLVDALAIPEFREALVSILLGESGGGPGLICRGQGLVGVPVETWSGGTDLLGVEQSNASVAVGSGYWLKLYRKLEAGVPVEVEMMQRLQEAGDFPHIPAVHGTLELTHETGAVTVGLLMERVTHLGDGWAFALTSLGSWFDGLLTGEISHETSARGAGLEQGMIAHCLSRMAQLGRRTAELHLALSRDGGDQGGFAPEPLLEGEMAGFHHALQKVVERLTGELKEGGHRLPVAWQPMVSALMDERAGIRAVLAGHELMPALGQKIRIHGDLHLAQVLTTGTDFVFIDFEGEPTLSLEERRLKKPALKDVAGMIRSFHYAAAAALKQRSAVEQACLGPMAQAWADEASRLFLDAYLARAGPASFLPRSREGRDQQLRFLLLEKAIAEVRYELNYRPTWADIPLRAVLSLIRPGEEAVPNSLCSNSVS